MKVSKLRIAIGMLFLVASLATMGHMRCSSGQAPSTVWSKQFGTSLSEGIMAVTTDNSRNLYAAGYINRNPPDMELQANDSFLTKYDSNGNVLWSTQISTNLDDAPNAITLDAHGNVFVGGGTSSSFFGKNLGSDDAFIVKYDSNGNQLWGKQFGTPSQDVVAGLAIDNQGNVVACGWTGGALFGSNTGPDNNGDPVQDSFIAKFDANGNQLWGKQFGADDNDEADGVAADNQGNIIVVGSTSAGYAKVLFGIVSGGPDAYIAKFSSTGTLLWGKQFGTSGNDEANAVCVDSKGNAYVGGYENVTRDDSSDGSGFAAKFDSFGHQQWNNLIGSNGESVSAIALDPLGNVLATGSTTAYLFAPNSGSNDFFVIKYDLTGKVIWTRQEGTIAADNANTICVDNQGYAYVGGDTQGSLFAINVGGEDAFIQKISPIGQTAQAKLQSASPRAVQGNWHKPL